MLAMMERVVQGVSTRKVSSITEEIGGKSFYKSTVSARCEAVDLVEEAFEDITAAISLPEKYRKCLRTTNSIERTNEEIHRRERVIRIFPNTDSAIRLIGAMLIEQHEMWKTARASVYHISHNTTTTTTTNSSYILTNLNLRTN